MYVCITAMNCHVNLKLVFSTSRYLAPFIVVLVGKKKWTWNPKS